MYFNSPENIKIDEDLRLEEELNVNVKTDITCLHLTGPCSLTLLLIMQGVNDSNTPLK